MIDWCILCSTEYSPVTTREVREMLEVICREYVVIDWCILVQSTHHQTGEGDAGGDLQRVGGD